MSHSFGCATGIEKLKKITGQVLLGNIGGIGVWWGPRLLGGGIRADEETGGVLPGAREQPPAFDLREDELRGFRILRKRAAAIEYAIRRNALRHLHNFAFATAFATEADREIAR
jgi:hypothetical protein